MTSLRPSQHPRNGLVAAGVGRLLRPLVAMIALAVLAIMPAAAAASYSPPVDLSASGQDAGYARVATSADGQTTAVWQRYDGTRTIVQAATRPPGSSTFSAPVDLSSPGWDAFDPRITIAPDGQTTVVWRATDYPAQDKYIQVATRPAGSAAFSAPVTVDHRANGSGDVYSPQIAAGPAGQTTVTWEHLVGSNYVVSEATRAAGSSTFSTPADLSDPAASTDGARVVFGPDGQTTIAWFTGDGVNVAVVQTRTRPAGSSVYGAAVDISAPGETARDPELVAGPDGQTTIVWKGLVSTYLVIRAATRDAGGSTFSSPANLSATTEDANDVQIAVGPTGLTTVAWTNATTPGVRYIQQATRPAGSSAFSAPESLTPTGGFSLTPAVAAGPGGQTTIAWVGSDGTNFIVQQRTRPAGSSTFSAPESLSTTGQDAEYYPQIAVGADGQTDVVWDRYDGSNYIVQTSSSAATFAKLSVGLAGKGTGAVASSPTGITCGKTCSAYFAIGSAVVLTATPAAGSRLTGWSGGGCSGAAATCTVTISAAATVTATFEPHNAPTVKVVKTTRSIGANAITLRSTVVVNGAGTITQKATASTGGKQTLCTAKHTSKAAGTYVLTCTMGRSAVRQLHAGPIRYALVTTFTNTTKATARATSKAMLARIPARPDVTRPEAVTG